MIISKSIRWKWFDRTRFPWKFLWEVGPDWEQHRFTRRSYIKPFKFVKRMRWKRSENEKKPMTLRKGILQTEWLEWKNHWNQSNPHWNHSAQKWIRRIFKYLEWLKLLELLNTKWFWGISEVFHFVWFSYCLKMTKVTLRARMVK